MTADKLEVAQSDRDAAAKYYASHMGGGPQFCSYVRDARTGDTNALVQAFARHRLAERERIAAWIAVQRNNVPATGEEFATAIRSTSHAE